MIIGKIILDYYIQEKHQYMTYFFN